MNFYSQAKQDEWICYVLNYKRNGYFVDLGAYDGIQTSNTYVLEKEFGWSGICVEANPNVYSSLIKNRSCETVFAAVSDYDGKIQFGHDKIDHLGPHIVPCLKLDTLLLGQKEIDYLSIDIEGTEFTVLNDFNFKNWDIKLITVEHNLYCDGPYNKNRLHKLLSENLFTRVVDNAVCLDKNPLYFNQPYEDWYISNAHLDQFKSRIEEWNKNERTI